MAEVSDNQTNKVILQAKPTDNFNKQPFLLKTGKLKANRYKGSLEKPHELLSLGTAPDQQNGYTKALFACRYPRNFGQKLAVTAELVRPTGPKICS